MLKMKTIKLTPYRASLGRIFDRQTKGHELMSLDGRYKFLIGNDVKEADFWVIQGKGVRVSETCKVAPENTIVLTTEPRSVLIYPDKYLKQFGLVCTCQKQTRHKNVHLGPAILPWFVGYDERQEDNPDFKATLDYDILKQIKPEKKKLISVITSNKAFTQGHIDRIRFVNKLKEHFGDQLDIFGRGFNSFGDKWEVLADYKYHIVIENSSQDYYWSEKLGDCFLAETYPFYYGCTNINDFFPEGSYTAIDISKPDDAIAIIDEAISNDIYAGKKDILHDCKELCLDKYNMFEYIASLCDTLDASLPKSDVTIQPCHSRDSFINLWRYIVTRTYYKWKNKLVNRNVNLK